MVSKQGQRWLRRRDWDEEDRSQREAGLLAARMPQSSEVFRAMTRGFAEAGEEARKTWGAIATQITNGVRSGRQS